MEEIIKLVKETVLELGGNCYIVGGYIRDSILNVKKKFLLDIDLVYDGDINLLIDKLKYKGMNFYLLDKEVKIFKGNFKNTNIDITEMKGESIEEDLFKRDFTINAIAFDILKNETIDPFYGVCDIKLKRLKEVSDLSIKNDSIRILRGIRFSMIYDLKIDLNTEKNIKSQSVFLMNCPKERLFDEFMKILHYDVYGNAFKFLDEYGILKHLIPEVDNLKTVGKCKYHEVDAFTHMNTSYIIFKKVEQGEISLNGVNVDKIIKKKLAKFDVGDFLGFATFTHDIGKYKSYKREGHKVSFIGHDKVGGKIIKDICNNLSFPNKAKDIIETIVEAHMYPLSLFKSDLNDYKKSFYKFFSYYENYIPYILLVSFCDVYATRLYKDENNEKEKYKVFIEKMFREYEIYNKIKNNRLVDGNEIKSITGSKGKEIGDIIEQIDKLRYLNKLKSKEDIICYIIKLDN